MPEDELNQDRDSTHIIETLTFSIDSPGNGVDKIVDQITPNFGFQVTNVEIFPKTVSSQAQVDVRIGGTTVLNSEFTDPTAEQITAATLASALADRRGTDTDTIDVVADTDGTGDIDAEVRVQIRPYPSGGDIGA